MKTSSFSLLRRLSLEKNRFCEDSLRGGISCEISPLMAFTTTTTRASKKTSEKTQ